MNFSAFLSIYKPDYPPLQYGSNTSLSETQDVTGTPPPATAKKSPAHPNTH